MMRIQRPARVLLSGREGARYATDVESGRLFELNETAFLVLDGAKDVEPVGRLVDVLRDAYPDVPADEIERDVRELVQDLLREGLLDASP